MYNTSFPHKLKSMSLCYLISFLQQFIILELLKPKIPLCMKNQFSLPWLSKFGSILSLYPFNLET